MAGNLPPGQVTSDGFDDPLDQDGMAAMTIAPSDGNIAYACMAPASPPGEYRAIWASSGLRSRRRPISLSPRLRWSLRR
jgi:hypothetical protein